MDEDQVNEEQGNDPERQEVTFTEGSEKMNLPVEVCFLLFVEIE